ncbi:hypothetical protein [Paraburkholderia sp. C35]|uniref:hypothetical protein n=1 Tax=Paraburkholderia sp. C35 TaxID=2126993 RepID=UPI0013A5A3A1|nr:hypothetical protein [Paraburkholderia sp. C35]
MSQRILRTTIGGLPARVSMGWSRAGQSHRMVIQIGSEESEPLFMDERPARKEVLGYFSEMARAFGIELPEPMVATLMTDEILDIGDNNISWFDVREDAQSTDQGGVDS